MSSLLNQGIGTGLAGYGLAGQLKRALMGDPKKVTFVQNNVALVEFDACLNESHGLNTAPSAFPLEDGGMVSDHIQVAPFELQLAGIKTDTPIGNREETLRSFVVSAAAAVGGPIGILGGATAAGSAYMSLDAQNKSQSPSQATYEALMRLGAGTPGGASAVGPVPATYPQIFDVHTSLKRYASMCIRNMQVQRDASTGYAIVFNLTLAQIRTATSQQVIVSTKAQPKNSQVKKKLAEGEGTDNAVSVSYAQGKIIADKSAFGKAANALQPGIVPQ